MAAGIGGGELEVGVELLGGVDRQEHGLAVDGGNSASVGVEHKGGVDQIAPVADEPGNAVIGAALLGGGEGEDDVAVTVVALAFQADEGGHKVGIAVFHVLGAASVEEAVFLNELEWIGGPVFAACFNHIEVSNEQQRLVFPGSVQAYNEILLPIVRAADKDVFFRVAGIAETLCHALGSSCHIANRVCGVDLNQLLEHIMRILLGGVVQLGSRTQSK